MSKKIADELRDRVLDNLRNETPHDRSQIVISYVRADFIDAIDRALSEDDSDPKPMPHTLNKHLAAG